MVFVIKVVFKRQLDFDFLVLAVLLHEDPLANYSAKYSFSFDLFLGLFFGDVTVPFLFLDDFLPPAADLLHVLSLVEVVVVIQLKTTGEQLVVDFA